MLTPFVNDEIIDISRSISFSPDLMTLSFVGKINVEKKHKIIDHMDMLKIEILEKFELSILYLRLYFFKNNEIAIDKISCIMKNPNEKKIFNKELEIEITIIPIGKETEIKSNNFILPLVAKNASSNPSHIVTVIKSKERKFEIIFFFHFLSGHINQISQNQLHQYKSKK